MPTVIVRLRRGWLPKGNNDPTTPQEELTCNMLKALRLIVAETMNVVDGTKLTAKDIVVVPKRLHPRAENVTDWWINVSPSDIKGRRKKRRRRRFRVAKLVKTGVEALVGESLVRPSIDAECAPIDSSGLTTNSKGRVIATWGNPRKRKRRAKDN